MSPFAFIAAGFFLYLVMTGKFAAFIDLAVKTEQAQGSNTNQTGLIPSLPGGTSASPGGVPTSPAGGVMS